MTRACSDCWFLGYRSHHPATVEHYFEWGEGSDTASFSSPFVHEISLPGDHKQDLGRRGQANSTALSLERQGIKAHCTHQVYYRALWDLPCLLPLPSWHMAPEVILVRKTNLQALQTSHQHSYEFASSPQGTIVG